MINVFRNVSLLLATVVLVQIASGAQADARNDAVARIEASSDFEMFQNFLTWARGTAVNCEVVIREDEINAVNQAIKVIAFDRLDIAEDMRPGLEQMLASRYDQSDPVYIADLIPQNFSEVVVSDEETTYVLKECGGFSSRTVIAGP